MTKVCTKCGKEKDTSEFSRRATRTDGLNSWCKVCMSEYHKLRGPQYRSTHSEVIRERKRKWDEQNRDHNRKYCRDRYHQNPAIFRELARKAVLKLNGYITSTWKNINGRTINGSSPKWKDRNCRHYLDKGIRLEMTRDEFSAFVASHWDEVLDIRASGGKPSIDRIDSSKHYSLDNIRIIPLKENTMRPHVHSGKTTTE